ncbi:hypothetical protein [Prochlorothrix hollandica]|uniref:hypothetical protein n=1 Tax=Prochlorothrix hollandica TaxID=1223 RepID=UPI0011D1BFA5|nr:hypothetical protein [Prochlorothrix hollandica]
MNAPFPEPCPNCGPQGHLMAILLTDALGCDRCQGIFVIQPDGQTLEQMASPTPQPRQWRWDGQQWRRLRPPSDRWRWGLTGVVTLGLLALPLVLNGPVPGLMVLWLGVFGVGVVLAGLVVWMAHRR